MTEPIDVESNTMAVAISQPQPIQQQRGLFGTDDPASVMQKAGEIATILRDVLRRQKLITNIQGREYPKCEAWTLLGNMLGIYPVLVWTKPVDGGWEARVEAKTKDGSVIGAAEAQCLRDEKNWSNRDDFALRSMAQTRATAKCLRMPLGFVMTMADFMPTPAEEMDFEQSKPAAAPAPSPRPDPKPAAPKLATAATLKWMREQLHAAEGEPGEAVVTEYFQAISAILPTETLADLPLNFVPTTKEALNALAACVGSFENGDTATTPTYVDRVPADPPAKAAKAEPAKDDEPWRSFPVPWGKDAGTPLGKLSKNKLFGWWANYVVEREYNGKARSASDIAKGDQFRMSLDMAGHQYGFTKKDNLGSE